MNLSLSSDDDHGAGLREMQVMLADEYVVWSNARIFVISRTS